MAEDEDKGNRILTKLQYEKFKMEEIKNLVEKRYDMVKKKKK